MNTIAERLARGFQLQRAGQLEEAYQLFRGILVDAPQNIDALHAVGLLLHQVGRHTEALDFLCQALVLHGPHPMIHSNLGAVYLKTRQPGEAATHCRAAIRLLPDLAIAHFNLGAALRHLDQLEEAEVAFRQAVRLSPTDVDALSNLGVVLHKLGRSLEALIHLENAVRLAPSHAQARFDLGSVLIATNEPEAGLEHLREAVRLKPDFAEAHDNLGIGLRYLDRIEEAIACFREALRLKPDYVQARNNLGNALEAVGKIDEAVAAFEETLRMDRDNAFATAALSTLASVGHYRFSASQIEAALARVRRLDLPTDDRRELHFALAAEFDRTGDCARAFEHYRAGNELRKQMERRRGAVFDPDAHDRFVDRFIAIFTPAYFERVRGFGLDSELPVFIVGMMRSGTTLAEQILASHPRVFGAGELSIVDNLINALSARLGVTDKFPEVMQWLKAETAHALATEHVKFLTERGGGAERVVDKLPANFLYLGMIATLLPRARIIHCRRDPIDTCLSCYMQNFGGSVPWSLDLVHVGRYFRAYARLMAHWAKVLPLPIFELNYEELTADTETISRRLVAFCGLEWDERCLKFHETERVVRTASVLQVRQPIYQSAIGRWKRYEAILGPLLEVLRQVFEPQRHRGTEKTKRSHR